MNSTPHTDDQRDEHGQIAPEDRLTQVNLSDDAIIQAGREALSRIASALTWADWKAIGKAVLILRGIAMREARINKPVGKRYTKAFGRLLEQHGFAKLDKATCARLTECMTNVSAIEAWRATLTANKRDELNYPGTILKSFKAATQTPAGDKEPSAFAKMREAVTQLEEEKYQLKREIAAGGGDVWRR
jgi:hypothetical protein